VNQRNDFLHKLSRFYVNNLIAMEHLNIYRLSGKILDASWGKFMLLLQRLRELVGWWWTPRGDLTKTFRMGVRQGTIIAACRILSLRAGTVRSNACGDGTLYSASRLPLVVAGQVPSLKQEAPCESWG